MKKWILKAIVQKIISYLPLKHKFNYFFQKYVTKGVDLTDEYFFDRLKNASNHIKSYMKISGKMFPENCLELGTGWYPTVPLTYFLTGADRIFSVDISFLTSKKRIKNTLEKFIICNQKGILSNYINFIPERLSILENLLQNYEQYSLEEVLQKLKITYLIEDARKLSLNENSINLISSNNTFEHIYPHILKPILTEFKRVVNKENGVMSHLIDMSDHFSHLDKSINVYNFLQFSDNQWKWIDNSIQPQSRLRIYDYRTIYQDLNIPITEEVFSDGNLNELNSIKLDDKFSDKSLKEIAISNCHFISDMKNKK